MFKRAGFLIMLLAGALAGPAAEPAAGPATAPGVKAPARKVVVYVIPIREEINEPTFFLLRRGLKEAIENKAETVVLDMKTRGGPTDAMFSIMEALDKFPGETVTFIDDEAGSAGAVIAGMTREIYFAPKGVMGAALAVQAGGEDIPETMRMKVTSFYGAKASAYAEGKGRYRIDVVRGMMDAKFELKINDSVIKEKDSVLTLRASQAIKTYGEPPEPLLATGIAEDLDSLLTKKFGAGNFTIRQYKVTWSEQAAQYMNAIAPILMGLGLLAIFIEFKAPSHGLFAAAGVLLLLIVFFGHFVAGLSGHEPVLAFSLGLLLLAAEVFFFPGAVVPALLGLGLMLGSLVWAMADFWPNEPVNFSGDVLVRPLTNLGLGLSLSIVLAVVLLRYLPKGWMWDKMVVGSAIGGAAQVAGVAPDAAHAVAAIIGRHGVAMTVLRPSGQVEIDGRRFEATVEVGAVDAGDAVVVLGRTDFALIVRKAGA